LIPWDKEGRVVVAEANAPLLKAAIGTIKDSGVISDERLIFVSGSNEESMLSNWSAAFSALDPARTKVAIHMPSFQLIPEKFPKVLNAVEMIRMERRFPLVLGECEKKNFRRNLPLLLRSQGIARLAGAVKGGVAAVVGAGPTLDKNILFLQAFRRMTIMSSDTALPALIENSITPDLVFTADPQDTTRLHFDMAGKRDIPMALVPTANADVVSEWSGPLYFGFIKPDRFPAPANTFARSMGVFESGGSVSCLALETAILMGAKTVILFGQDFGFPADKAYATWTVPGILNEKLPDDSELVLEHDYFGRPVKTSRSLYGYRRNVENLVQSGAARVFTLSAEGVKLAGVDPVPTPGPLLAGAENARRFVPAANERTDYDPSVERAFLEWLDTG
jgi:hypothetical protein